MDPSGDFGKIEAYVEGQVTGRVAVGDFLVQIGSAHGGLAGRLSAAHPIRPQSRELPVWRLPVKRGCLGREAELARASTSIYAQRPVVFYGGEGFGKTTLLSEIAHDAHQEKCPHGVVYRNAAGLSLSELLQKLYGDFFECGVPFLASDAQLRRDLAKRQALILLDDCELDRDDLPRLIEYLPRCSLVLASAERTPGDVGQAIEVAGLAAPDALSLIERELERPLAAAERRVATSLCRALHGHPLRLRQVVVHLMDRGQQLAAATHVDQTAAKVMDLLGESLATLSPPQRQLLGLLAALDGVPLTVERLAKITKVLDDPETLDELTRRGLAQADDGRVSVSGELAAAVRDKVSPEWLVRLCIYYLTWVARHQREPARLIQEIDPVLYLLEWAVSARLWGDALSLARGIDPALALDKRWSMWGRVLAWARQAAEELGDREAEAWALHQAGTRALCLGDDAAAQEALDEALRIRASRGDTIAAEFSRRNLAVLTGAVDTDVATTMLGLTGGAKSSAHWWSRRRK